MTLKFFYLRSAWLSTFPIVIRVVRRKVMDQTQMQVQQRLLDEHEPTQLTAKRLVRCRQRWRNFHRLRSILFCFGFFFWLRGSKWHLVDLFFRLAHKRIILWSVNLVTKEVDGQFIEAEENFVAQRAFDRLAVHFDQIQLEGLDVREARQAAQGTR